MEALDEAVGLRPAHLRRAVFDLLELQEQLVGVLVLAASVLPTVVAHTVSTFTPCSSKKGSSSLSRTWTAVTGIFDV